MAQTESLISYISKLVYNLKLLCAYFFNKENNVKIKSRKAFFGRTLNFKKVNYNKKSKRAKEGKKYNVIHVFLHTWNSADHL